MNGLANRINTRFDGYHGLVIDKSTSSQTICQTTKYQTNIGGISPNHLYGFIGYMGYRGYRDIKVCYEYRPTPDISHTETLNVSHSGRGYMGGYIKRYQISLLAYIRHIRHMRLYGLMV